SFEKTPLDNDGKPKPDREKLLWTGNDFLLFQVEQGKVVRFPEKSPPKAPPIPFCIPFLFQIGPERASGSYVWSLVKEEADQVLIAAVKRDESGQRSWPNKYIVSLDKRTYLPRKIYVYSGDDSET